MNKAELKQILKPLIKECIKEVIFETGVLSKVVTEVAQGLGGNANAQPIREENMTSEKKFMKEASQSQRQESSEKIEEYKRRFAEQVSRDNFGGIEMYGSKKQYDPTRDLRQRCDSDEVGNIMQGIKNGKPKMGSREWEAEKGSQ